MISQSWTKDKGKTWDLNQRGEGCFSGLGLFLTLESHAWNQNWERTSKGPGINSRAAGRELSKGLKKNSRAVSWSKGDVLRLTILPHKSPLRDFWTHYHMDHWRTGGQASVARSGRNKVLFLPNLGPITSTCLIQGSRFPFRMVFFEGMGLNSCSRSIFMWNIYNNKKIKETWTKD